MNMSFSQRIGAVKIPEEPIAECAGEGLRNRVWNLLDTNIWKFYRYKNNPPQRIKDFVSSVWSDFLNWRLDEMSHAKHTTLNEIKAYFFNCHWHEFFSLLEFICSITDEKFAEKVNVFLEREYSAYRFIEGQIVEIHSEEERQEISSAIKNTSLDAVKEHLVQALKHLNDRDNPDYRNSIKESISSVEALCRHITNDDNATLGQALKLIERDHVLHSALKEAFSKLYGYLNLMHVLC